MIPAVSEIETMNRAALIAAWSDLLGTSVPKGLSQPFLRRFLAYEVQARRLGGLPKDVLRTLATKGPARPSPSMKAGGRILREWNGVTHVVDVLDVGFRWNGTTYRSLSAIARAITGTRWNGWVFFGLKNHRGRT